MKPNQEQLRTIEEKMYLLDARHAVGTAVKDLFAIGCWLHGTGKREAGLKAVSTSLTAINLDKTNRALFLAFMDHLPGNEYEFARAIKAHEEINSLLEGG